jgi:mono/diheme cytochrome c family protein
MRKNLALVLGLLIILVGIPSLMAEDAAATFKAKCAACHGPDAAGQTAVGKNLKIRDLHSADVQKQSDADLAKIIEGGKGKMPSFKGKLTTDEINGLVKYIRGLKK